MTELARSDSGGDLTGQHAAPFLHETEDVPISPEVQKRIEAVREALAQKFERSPDDFDVVSFRSEDGSVHRVVMMTAPNGLHMGSWDQVMSKDRAKDFEVEVDGEIWDTRAAMTFRVYQAFIKNEVANRKFPIADSESLFEQGGELRTGTLLTGKEPSEGYVYVGRAEEGSIGSPTAGYYGAFHDDRSEALCVRPAIEVQ